MCIRKGFRLKLRKDLINEFKRSKEERKSDQRGILDSGLLFEPTLKAQSDGLDRVQFGRETSNLARYQACKLTIALGRYTHYSGLLSLIRSAKIGICRRWRPSSPPSRFKACPST